MDFAQMAGLLLSSSAGCYGAPIGQIDYKKRVYQSPETFMMNFMLNDEKDRDRFYRIQLESSECETEFIRMDEEQFIRTARSACAEAYLAVFEKDPDLLTILSETDSTPIYYHGGFRQYVLNISNEDGYGYDIVGKTLVNIRRLYCAKHKKQIPKLKEVLESVRDSVDPLAIGLIVLVIKHLWALFVHGKDDLVGFLGKSAQEIASILHLHFDEQHLRFLQSRLLTVDAFQDMNGLTHAQIHRLVEYEILYPGNLVGFIRKLGINRYLTTIRQSVYYKLWNIIAIEVMETKYPHIPSENYKTYISANSDPVQITRHGAALVDRFLSGSLTISNPDDHAFITSTLQILQSPHYYRDALFFVPRVYVLQHLDSPMNHISLLDSVDYDDMTDALSPNYDRNLTIHDKLFPTVLHYMYYRCLCSYFPKMEHERLYRECMYTEDDRMISGYGDAMTTRFAEIIRAHRISLIMEGLKYRIQCNPVFLSLPFYAQNMEKPIENEPDNLQAVRIFEETAESEFSELCQFFRTCREHDLALPIVETVFRVWLAVWVKLCGWIHFVRMVYPSLKMDACLEIFFTVFYKDDIQMIHDMTPSELVLPVYTDIVSSLIRFLSLYIHPDKSVTSSTTLKQYITKYIAAVSAYCHASSPDALPKTFTCPSGSSSSPAKPTCESFFETLAIMIQNFITLCPQHQLIWDDRVLLYMQFFITDDQMNEYLLPMKRTIVIPTEPGKKDICIKSQLKPSPFVSSDILAKFDFLFDTPSIVKNPTTTLTQLSHLRF